MIRIFVSSVQKELAKERRAIKSFILGDPFLMRFIREKPEYVLGVLNSKLVSWWFVHKFGKMQRGTFPQFKVNELADFPLPKDGAKHCDRIASLASDILDAKKSDPSADTTAQEREIDQIVYRLYDLTPDEIQHIEKSLANTNRSTTSGNDEEETSAWLGHKDASRNRSVFSIPRSIWVFSLS